MHVTCSCGARLKVSEAMRGRKSKCPRCGRVFRIPPPEPEPVPAAEVDEGYAVEEAVDSPDPEGPVWVPHETGDASAKPSAKPRWRRRILTLLAILVPVLAAVALVVVPPLIPKDDREVVVQKYLKAVQEGRLDDADRLAVISDHPRIAAHDDVFIDETQTEHLAGRFDGLSRLHRKMDEAYDWHSNRGRFFKTDQIGTGLEVLDQLTDAKKKLEESGAYDKLYQIGDPGASGDEGFDAMMQIFGSVGNLATNGGPVSRENLSPHYDELMDKLKPDLTQEEKALAKRFALEPMKWDRLLGRDFVSLQGGGQFSLDEAMVTARAYGEVSPGVGGRVLNLRLVRFHLGQIDTGWKIWSINSQEPIAPDYYSEGAAKTQQ